MTTTSHNQIASNGHSKMNRKATGNGCLGSAVGDTGSVHN
jgi:hypothetical protein